MTRFKLIGGLTLAVVLAVGGLIAWWALDVRWRPKTITRHKEEITELLTAAGWVSSGGGVNKLYMISFRSCEDCIRFEHDEFPRLHKANVDTRVIAVARADKDGVSHSTAAERATVAQLWLDHRQWGLYQAWQKAAPAAWTAEGIPAADGDIARTAIVEGGRKLVSDLTPLLKDNGINFAYPLLIWQTKDGEMKGCACEKKETYRFVRKDLGA
jgi:hypothetical protein